MSKHMETRSNARHDLLEQRLAAHVRPCDGRVQNPVRRAMRDQEIDICRHFGPMLLVGKASRDVERAATASNRWRHGRAKDLDASNHQRPVFQVRAVRQQSARAAAVPRHVVRDGVHADVVTTRNHDFDRMRQRPEPLVKVADLVARAAMGKVATVHEDVAAGHVHELPMPRVGVRDAHHAQRLVRRSGATRAHAQPSGRGVAQPRTRVATRRPSVPIDPAETERQQRRERQGDARGPHVVVHERQDGHERGGGGGGAAGYDRVVCHARGRRRHCGSHKAECTIKNGSRPTLCALRMILTARIKRSTGVCALFRFARRRSLGISTTISLAVDLLRRVVVCASSVAEGAMEKVGRTDGVAACELPDERSSSRSFGAIMGLQFLTAASFGFMSPMISLVMTEYFARLHRDGMPIDCGAHSRNEACIKGSQEAAWLSSLFSASGSVVNFILAPVLGQASDVYGRKPFLVLSQFARVGIPFVVMYMMRPAGSIAPYFALRLIDYGFGTAGVLSAAVADVVASENRAAAFGVLFASLSVGYCASAFVASLLSREHILQIAAALFVSRVLWAMFILPETLPTRARTSKIRWVLESPISSMSILFRNKLFMRLTCLIALTSFVSNGIIQIQPFYLNSIVGFDVKDFGIMRLLGGGLALVGQGLLLQPLVSCCKEKGVIIIAMIATSMNMAGFAGTAFYPHKWAIYVSCMPGLLSDLSFPAIAALKSINVSDKEQGRLQGAIYGARSVFAALGPVIFSTLYAAMNRQSRWSQALPYVVAASIYFLGIGVALSLPVSKLPGSRKAPAMPDALPSPTRADSLSSSSVYFETDDEETDEGGLDARRTDLDGGEDSLAEPLLGSRSSPAEV